VAELLLALDFGGTKHTAAVAAADEREWRAHRFVFSPPYADADYDLATVRALAWDVLGGERPTAIGVSFGGPVDATTGTVHLSYHVPGWENVPLRQVLEAEFGAPASVDNDANVAALGEHRFGAGRGSDSLLYVTVSTGVGGGWILRGQPWRGTGGMAGEIGHMVVDPDGPVCVCGRRGCVERLASGPYIAQRARAWLATQPDRGQVLRRLIGDDPAAVTAQLGGGVTKAGERFWEMIRRVARQTALPQVDFDVVPAALGDDAPLWGALALAQDCLPGRSVDEG
jgi:glucokinase